MYIILIKSYFRIQHFIPGPGLTKLLRVRYLDKGRQLEGHTAYTSDD